MSFSSNLTRLLLAATALTAGAALAQAPANDTCAGAESITVGTTRVQSTAAINLDKAAATPETSMSCATTSKNSTWYTFTVPTTGFYRFDTCAGTNVDTTIAIYTGTCGGTLTAVTSSCTIDGCGPGGAAAGAVSLTAGTTYWLQVAAASTATLTASSTWTVGIEPIATTTPNRTCSQAAPLAPSSTPGVAVTTPYAVVGATTVATEMTMPCISSKNDTWYAVTPTVSGYYRIDTCQSSNYDTVISLWSGACGTLAPVAGACNDQGSCTPSNASAMTAYMSAGGTYFLQVSAWGSTTTTAGSMHSVNVTLQPTGVSNDYCSAQSPVIPLATTIDVSTLSPDAGAGLPAAFDDFRTDGGFIGIGHTTGQSPGRDVAYQFRATDPGNYSFRLSAPLTGSPTTAVLAITDSCVAQTAGPVTYSPPQLMYASNRGTAAEEIVCAPLTANQNVFVWVDESSLSTAGGTYLLEVNRCYMETESNDTPAAASSLSCMTTGSIADAGEVDYFALGGFATSDAGVVPRLFAMAESYAANALNIDMRVTTDTNTIEYDNDNLDTPFGSSAPAVAGVPLPMAPAYLRINQNSTTTLTEPYVIYSAVQTGDPTPEVEPNDIIDAGSRSATNYFIGTLGDAGDSDFFTFSANAGDVIFAALDAVPFRTNTAYGFDAGAGGPGAPNFSMQLLGADGGTLVSVADTNTTMTFSPPDGGLTSLTPAYPSEALTWRARVTGDYAIRVSKTGSIYNNPYLLSVTVGCRDVAPTLDATITPNIGTPTGGQLVTLTGTNFSTRSVVRFGTGIATIVGLSPTELVVMTPPAAPGDVNVSVTNGVGLTATRTNAFTYDDPAGVPPTLTSLNPTFGPVAGGNTVELNGSVFRRDAGVFFDVGGIVAPAQSVTFVTGSRVRVVAPPHDAGLASVTLINYDGLSSTITNGYLYQPAPVITSVAPDGGLTLGGETVTLTGTDFRPGASVRFGGTLASGIVVADGGLTLTAVTPAQTTNGTVDVTVTNSDFSSFTLPASYVYRYPAPVITSLNVTQGPTAGATGVTITGQYFLPNPQVTVGGAAATNVVRVSATSITLVTPPGTQGLADVVVTNSDGQSATRAAAFRYIAPPQLASLTPTHGPVQGGTLITLTGQDILPGARVTIGGVPAFAVTVANSTTVTAVTNANVAGPADVVLTNFDGQFATLTGAFTFDPAPAITSVSPVSGSTAGGTMVTVTGSGFLAGAEVLFGSTPATTVTRVSATELNAVSPARAVGVVSITVRNPDGQVAELPRSYRFVTPPALTAIAPASGDAAGGTVVKLTGDGFTAGTTVKFGTTPATQVSFVSATEVQAIAPAHAPGAVDVVVDVDGASVTLAGAFTYTRNAPTLSAIAPVSGPIAGGTLVTLAGTGFAEGATVTIGGTAATDVVIVSSVLARAVAPAHAAGAVDVVITNDDMKSATLAGAYTYVTAPSGETGTLPDGGSGAIGSDPVIPTPVPGGVSCGCSSFDPASLSLAGLGVLMVLSRRRRRS